MSENVDQVLRLLTGGNHSAAFLLLSALAFARIFSFVQTARFFGDRMIFSPVKIAISLGFLILVYPTISFEMQANDYRLSFGSAVFFALICKEIFVGFTLGFVASAAFEAVRGAARLIDAQSGGWFDARIDSPPLENFKFLLATAIFFAVGAHLWFLRGFLESFNFLPLAKFPVIAAADFPQFFIEVVSQIFAVAVQLAAAPLAALLIADLFCGVAGRVAPQFNAFWLFLSVRTILIVLVLAVAVPFLLEQILLYFRQTAVWFETVIRLLSQ
jgi:flagellar biosynthetic protein FliR